jgi:hypothetical protein
MPTPLLQTIARLLTPREAIKKFTIVIFMTSVISLSQADERISPRTNYLDSVSAVKSTMQTYHYNPDELQMPEYRRIEAEVSALSERATSDEEFIEGFREIWASGPFSHVTVTAAKQSAEDLASYLDTMRVGGGGATLAWRGTVAILTVSTMMGLDTIEEIDAAYAVIAERDTSGLIIDLRQNTGGAFAVRPLVSHLIMEPFDAGTFVSQPWNAVHDHEPALADLEAVDPWEGWSIKAFWADVQTNPVTRIRFSPAKPVFDGPVYVLTSKNTASAAELATDALKVAERVTTVGERTAGEMLSQKIFDIPGELHLSLPIADYYSIVNGRIEGVGIEPDIATEAAQALDVALKILDDQDN